MDEGNWEGFNETEMDIMLGCLDLARNSWNLWLDNNNLPPGWEPDHAEIMIEHIEGIIHKFNAIGVMLPHQEAQEHQDEQPLRDNVYQFPNTASNAEEE
jgi:hypothetical protein